MSEQKSIAELATEYGKAMEKVASTVQQVRSAERDLQRAEREETVARQVASKLYAELQKRVSEDAEQHK